MAKHKGSKHAEHVHGIHKGLTDKGPKQCDASTTFPKVASVNHDAVRTHVAKTPKTLGPRTA